MFVLYVFHLKLQVVFLFGLRQCKSVLLLHIEEDGLLILMICSPKTEPLL